MTVGKHKTVTVDPLWILGIMCHGLAPQDLSNICHAHWGTWVTRVGLLHAIHAQYADCISKFICFHPSLQKISNTNV